MLCDGVIYILVLQNGKKKKNYELQGQAGMLYSVMHILTDGGVKEQVQSD